jgi:ribose 5-phosphate isomerase B
MIYMKIAIGSDHDGFELKQNIIKLLKELNHDFKDFGTFSSESCDYSDFASKVAKALSNKDFQKGILICSTGIGMSIAANKIPGIRAALCYNTETAKQSREHIDSNILILGAEHIDLETAKEIVKIWLTTDFSKEERHQRRINKIKEIEGLENE